MGHFAVVLLGLVLILNGAVLSIPIEVIGKGLGLGETKGLVLYGYNYEPEKKNPNSCTYKKPWTSLPDFALWLLQNLFLEGPSHQEEHSSQHCGKDYLV